MIIGPVEILGLETIINSQMKTKIFERTIFMSKRVKKELVNGNASLISVGIKPISDPSTLPSHKRWTNSHTLTVWTSLRINQMMDIALFVVHMSIVYWNTVCFHLQVPVQGPTSQRGHASVQ